MEDKKDFKNSQVIGSNTPDDIKDKAIKSMKWSVLVELTPRLIVPVTTLIFVRILSPSDFGLMTMATIFVGLAGMFQDFGLAKALIREKEDTEDSANVVFWSNFALSIIIYALIFLLAPLAALFFNEPRLTNILRVLCLQVVLLSLAAVQIAIFQRNFEFKKIFRGSLGFVVTPIFVTILLALLHFGVWALVLGNLTSYAVQLLILWFQSKWRPKFSFKLNIAKKLFNFGIWFTAEAFILWLLSYGDSASIGYFLETKNVGIYYIGLTLTSLIFGTAFNPLLSVAYSSFSKLQDDIDNLKSYFVKISNLLAVLIIPMGIGLILISAPIYSIFFKDSWSGIQIVISLLALVQMVAWLVGLNPTIYRALGRPDINFKIGLVSIPIYALVYISFAQYGLFIFCVGRILVAFITTAIHLFVMNKLINLKPFYIFNSLKMPILSVIPMAFLIYSAIHFGGSFVGILGIAKLLMAIILGISTYVGTLYLINRDSLKQTLSLLLKVAK